MKESSVRVLTLKVFSVQGFKVVARKMEGFLVAAMAACRGCFSALKVSPASFGLLVKGRPASSLRWERRLLCWVV